MGNDGPGNDMPDTSLPLSLATARGIALCQFILLLLSLACIVLASAALRRLAPALTHPTRCMLTVAVTTGVGVLASLALAVQAVWRVGQGRVVVEGDDAWLCAYALPVLRASHVATWCANVGMALATLRTVRGQAMAPRTQLILRTVVGIVGTSAIIRYELMAPGRPLWGLFCVTPLLDPRHLKVRSLVDPRSVSILGLVGTFLASAVLYTVALRALGREQARLLEEEAVASGDFPLITAADRGLDVVIKLQMQIRTQQRRQEEEEQQQQQEQQRAAAAEATTGGRDARRNNEERARQRAARRLRKIELLATEAGFAVLGRSMVLFLACYLPSLVTIAARLLHWGSPNPDSALLALLFIAGSAGTCLLQGLVLLRTAATVGENLLHHGMQEHDVMGCSVSKAKGRRRRTQRRGPWPGLPNKGTSPYEASTRGKDSDKGQGRQAPVRGWAVVGALAFRGETDTVARLVRRRIKCHGCHDSSERRRVELIEENLRALSLGGDWEDRGSSSSGSSRGDGGCRAERGVTVEHRRPVAQPPPLPLRSPSPRYRQPSSSRVPMSASVNSSLSSDASLFDDANRSIILKDDDDQGDLHGRGHGHLGVAGSPGDAGQGRGGAPASVASPGLDV